jgi:hypothetical protein
MISSYIAKAGGEMSGAVLHRHRLNATPYTEMAVCGLLKSEPKTSASSRYCGERGAEG